MKYVNNHKTHMIAEQKSNELKQLYHNFNKFLDFGGIETGFMNGTKEKL